MDDEQSYFRRNGCFYKRKIKLDNHFYQEKMHSGMFKIIKIKSDLKSDVIFNIDTFGKLNVNAKKDKMNYKRRKKKDWYLCTRLSYTHCFVAIWVYNSLNKLRLNKKLLKKMHIIFGQSIKSLQDYLKVTKCTSVTKNCTNSVNLEIVPNFSKKVLNHRKDKIYDYYVHHYNEDELYRLDNNKYKKKIIHQQNNKNKI